MAWGITGRQDILDHALEIERQPVAPVPGGAHSQITMLEDGDAGLTYWVTAPTGSTHEKHVGHAFI